MRKLIGWGCICFLLTCFQTTVFAATPFDGFSSGDLDKDKWYSGSNRFDDPEGVVLVREVTGGKLVAKMSGTVNRPDEGSFDRFYNSLWIANPETVDTISAKVNLVEGSVSDTNMHVIARLEGTFYDEAGGTVSAELGVATNGSLFAFTYGIDAPGNWTEGPAFSITPNPGTEYTLKIDYNGANQFTFWVNNESHVMTGPTRTGEASSPYKSLTTKIQGNDSDDLGTGHISATFDDVETNGTPYEDFSASITESKWINGEAVREVRNNQLQMNLQSPGVSYETMDISLDPTYATDFFQADITIEGSTELNGVNTYAEPRIMGSYFNSVYDGSGYVDHQGDVRAMIRIRHYSDGTFRPFAQIYTCTSDCWNVTTQLGEDFTNCNVQLDTPVTVSIKKEGSTLTLSCNDDQIKHTLEGPLYAPEVNMRKLRSRVASTSGQNGYLRLNFDNIYVNEDFPWGCFFPVLMKGTEK